MLEKVDLSKKMEKSEAKERLEQLGAELGELQRRMRDAKIPVIIVFEGLGAAGKGIQINRLIQALDPRGFKVYSVNKENEEERLRPFLWRFWSKTPAEGEIAIFDRSWYRRVLVDRFDGHTDKKQIPSAYQDIASFERQLTEDGTMILKFFLYISQKEQEKRFDRLLEKEETAWRVSRDDLKRNKEYKKYIGYCEEMLEHTDYECAPWKIIEATDRAYASVKIMDAVVCGFKEALAKQEESAGKREDGIVLETHFQTGVLSGVDLTKEVGEKEYKSELDHLQNRLEFLHNELYHLRIPVILAFEGWDAAGKGGAIKRLTSKLDPRGYAVYPTSAPNDIEKRHHYMWRFWNNFPKAGHIAIFDRTWYGRVMVERIEGFCASQEWKRAYQEINETEEHLANSGAVILKFWLHIDKDEQERRFQERMQNPQKQWKITDEDWRNREKWDEYMMAVDEMLLRTSTTYAPWIVIEANSKQYARLKVLKTVVDALEKKIARVQKEKR